MGRLSCVLASAVVVAGGLACGREAGPSLQHVDPNAVARAQTLIIAATAEPRSLLAPFAVDLVAGQLCDQLYQRLAQPSGPRSGGEPRPFSTLGDADYEPDLATSWAWSVDSTHVRFELDPRARWHDGRPVTSRDVVFTYAMHADTTAGAMRGLPRGLLDSVTAGGPHTVMIWVTRPLPSVFHRVIYPVHILPAHLLASVAPRDIAAHALNRAPIGSGPFRFERWIPGDHIALARATDTLALRAGDTTHPSRSGPGTGEVPIRRVVLRVLAGQEAALRALTTGEVDVVDFARPEDLERLRGDPRIRLLSLPALTYTVLQWNLRAPSPARAVTNSRRSAQIAHPVLGDARVRRALAMAVDRAALVRNVLGETGQAALGPVTRAQPTSGTSLTLPAFDLRHARALLDSAGWRARSFDTAGGSGRVTRLHRPTRDTSRNGAMADVRYRGGQPLRLVVLVPTTSAPRRKAAVILQQMLAHVGAIVEIEALDNAAMLAAMRSGAFDGALMAFRVDPDPVGVVDVWGGAAAASGDGFNFGRYASPATDTLLAHASRAADEAAQRSAYRMAYQRIIDDAPAVFLYEPVAVVAHSARLQPEGIRPDAWWAHLARWRAHVPTP